MVEYLNANQHAFWFSAGFILLAIEALAFGFTSGLVLFAGFGALVTGGFMWAGLLPSTWTAGIAGFGVCSGVSAVLLWKPLLRFQKGGDPEKDRSSDLIGYEFRLQMDISHMIPGKTSYSGIDWRVEIDDVAGVDQIAAGEKVRVESLDAGVFRVAPATVTESGNQQ